MPALFKPTANFWSRFVITMLLVSAFGTPVALVLYMHTPDAHAQLIPIDQPIEFDHRHHVRDDGIDCRYCHSSVEQSEYAGVPPTDLCMGCHNQIWNSSLMVAPIRRSYFGNESIEWNRVHMLPDHVYFNHAIHVNKGVGCVTCHGRVDLMARVYKAQPLTMQWCLECHRDPEPHLRPQAQITAMEWVPPSDPAFGKKLAREYGVRRLTSCTTCHR